MLAYQACKEIPEDEMPGEGILVPSLSLLVREMIVFLAGGRCLPLSAKIAMFLNVLRCRGESSMGDALPSCCSMGGS